MYELLHLAGSQQCQISLISFCKYKDKIKPNLFFKEEMCISHFFALMGTSYILFPTLFLPSPSHHVTLKKIKKKKENHLFKIQFLLKTWFKNFKFLWLLYHILTSICIYFQHQMNPTVLEWSCSLLLPLGMVNYKPQSFCCFLVHIFFAMLQKNEWFDLWLCRHVLAEQVLSSYA